MAVNYFSIFRLVVLTGCTLVYALDILPTQAREVLRPHDSLTRLRWIIFAVLIVSILTVLPSLLYQYVRATGADSHALRSLTTVTSTFGNIATTVLVWLIFHYKTKE